VVSLGAERRSGSPLLKRTDWFSRLRRRVARKAGNGADRNWLSPSVLREKRGRYRPIRGILTTHRWESGAGYGVFNHQIWFTNWGDSVSRTASTRLRPATGPGHHRQAIHHHLETHTFIPEGGWFSPTAGIANGLPVTSMKRCRRSRSRPAINWPTFYVGALGFITRDFMWRADWPKSVVVTTKTE